MAAGQMAEFFATLGFKINQADFKKVDKQLDILELRAKKLSENSLSNIKMNISRFGFSDNFNTRLQKAIQARLRVASNAKGAKVNIRLDKFDIDQNSLLREMKEAVRYVENNIKVKLRSEVQRPVLTPGQQQPVGGALGAAAAVRSRTSGFASGMGAGATAGGLGRGILPGLGVGWGISQLNQLNQQLIGQDLAATAVFGGQEAGQEQLAWLRNLGNTIGFDYRSQANSYLKMQASAMTAGMDTSTAQHIFQSLAEYGRVMGLSDEDMKGTMRAVEQMLNKGQVYAEELKMQLAEKFPAAIQLMAEAVAGGDTQKLFEMMEAGEIVSLEALPKFADIIARQARVGGALTEAMKTSLAEQMRFNNTFNDLVMEFSEAGFEEGQAGIFRTMATFFEEMRPLLYGFGEAWRYVGALLRVPLGLLADLSTGIETVSRFTGMAKGDIVALGSAIALLAMPLTRTVSLIFAALAVFEDFTAFLTGRNSLIGELLGDDAGSIRQSFTSLFESLSSLLGTVFDLVESIVNLFQEEDLPLINVLKQFIEYAETMIEMINTALGGKSKEQRLAEKETQPHLRNAMMGQQEPQRGAVTRTAGALQTFVEKHPAMFIPRNIGVGTLLGNISNVTTNLQSDEQARQERMSLFRGDMQQSQGSIQTSESAISQFFDMNITIDGSQGNEETARQIVESIQQMLKPAAIRASNGGSD